jgi:hypothetical protein
MVIAVLGPRRDGHAARAGRARCRQMGGRTVAFKGRSRKDDEKPVMQSAKAILWMENAPTAVREETA